MARFERIYRLVVGKPNQKGVEIVPPLRITFEISKDAEEEPNEHSICIYNLASATRQAMEEPGLRCVLYAGYAEDGGALLMASGSVVFASTRLEPPDVITELRVKDGYTEVRDAAVSIGLGPGAQASSIIRDIAAQMGLALVMAEDVPDRRWRQGFSFYGAARTALHKVTQATGLEWSIQNQQLQVVARRGTTRRQATVLAADTGLLGYPERTREAAREKATTPEQAQGDGVRLVSARQQHDGCRVTSLLLPTINPADLVKLESRAIQALLRVQSLRHSGDSAEGDWKTELTLVERSAPP